MAEKQPLLNYLDSKPRLNTQNTALKSCNTKWFDTTWYGIVLYVLTACIQYIIGYYGVYRSMRWTHSNHTAVRIFGDLVTVAWFALGFVTLPWHKWEQLTCIKTDSFTKGLLRYLAFCTGTVTTFFVYGYMGQHSLFQSSLATTNLTHDQRMVYIVTFITIGAINIYWLAKLCPCKSCRHICSPDRQRKIIFLRIIAIVTMLFIISYILCAADDQCTYHLHHWWFGFVLVLVGTTTLDNILDYFLQGIFWQFLIESIFNYGITFGEFFI